MRVDVYRLGQAVGFKAEIVAGVVVNGPFKSAAPVVCIVPYSIQTLKRLKPDLFRQDLIALLKLLQQQKIKPLIARRMPLVEAGRAHELLGQGGVIGKIVLLCNEPWPELAQPSPEAL